MQILHTKQTLELPTANTPHILKGVMQRSISAVSSTAQYPARGGISVHIQSETKNAIYYQTIANHYHFKKFKETL